MPGDVDRVRGYLADLARQAAQLRSVDALRVLDRVASALIRWQERDGELRFDAMPQRRAADYTVIDDAIRAVAQEIAAEDRELAEQHERARDEVMPRTLTADARRRLNERRDQAVADAIRERPDLYREPDVHIGQPGDDLGEVAVPVDSDAPAATYVPRIVLATDDTATAPRDPRIRVVVDESKVPDELGGDG